MTNQVNITRHLRAAVIDWLFEIGTKLNIEDKGVLFQAVNLMDRFYNIQKEQKAQKLRNQVSLAMIGMQLIKTL